MMAISAAVMAPMKSEAKPSQHCADEAQLRGGRLWLQNDKRKREGAKQ
jgi:hypothetical protein